MATKSEKQIQAIVSETVAQALKGLNLGKISAPTDTSDEPWEELLDNGGHMLCGFCNGESAGTHRYGGIVHEKDNPYEEFELPDEGVKVYCPESKKAKAKADNGTARKAVKGKRVAQITGSGTVRGGKVRGKVTKKQAELGTETFAQWLVFHEGFSETEKTGVKNSHKYGSIDTKNYEENGSLYLSYGKYAGGDGYVARITVEIAESEDDLPENAFE